MKASPEEMIQIGIKMNNKLISLFIFSAGVAVGSIVTWQYLRFRSKDDDTERERKPVDDGADAEYADDEDEPSPKTEIVSELDDYKSQVNKHGYHDYSKISAKEPDADSKKKDEKAFPRVIEPDVFDDDFDGYTKISLTYFQDHVLADYDGHIIEDIEGTIGFESLNHIGEYEEDILYVRNNRLHSDFEISMDSEKYSDVYIQGRRR